MKIGIKCERFGIPVTKMKKEKGGMIGKLIVILIIALLISVGIGCYIRGKVESIAVHNDIDSTWIGSVASYWGGIVGGIISGTIGFLGVFYTIRYYKESDVEKERNSIQPFLLASPNMQDGVPITRRFSYETDNSEETYDYIVLLKNIGNGFANIITINTNNNFGGNEYNEVIEKDGIVGFCIEAKPETILHGAEFTISYIDAMRNEYIQKYTFKPDNMSYIIESGYPQFMDTV